MKAHEGFFCAQKLFLWLHKIKVEPWWCHMDYFTDVLIPLWALNVVVALLYAGSEISRNLSKYLNLSSEYELMGLEWHKGELLMTEY